MHEILDKSLELGHRSSAMPTMAKSMIHYDLSMITCYRSSDPRVSKQLEYNLLLLLMKYGRQESIKSIILEYYFQRRKNDKL